MFGERKSIPANAIGVRAARKEAVLKKTSGFTQAEEEVYKRPPDLYPPWRRGGVRRGGGGGS